VPVMRDDAEADGRRWCSWCGQQVRARDGRPPVHVATGRQTGEDNHLAAPADREPELWKAAREITADYHGAFRVDARFGILRADWSPEVIGYATTAMHYTASGRAAEADMRRQLDEAVAGTRWERERSA
jgi:hypothetical protein